MLWRLVPAILILLVGSPLWAVDPVVVGVVEGNGAVYVNGSQLTNSSAVTVGDVLQTKDAGVAHVTSAGASVSVQSNTIIRFQDAGVALDRGTVSVATGKVTSILARDFKITPSSTSWTQYDVIRASGSIQIFARKNSLTVSCGTAKAVVVQEGQEISRDDGANCGLAETRAGARPAATGPIITTATMGKAALLAGAGLALWSGVQSDNPLSPSTP